MTLTKLQYDLLQQGLSQTVTNAEKWQVLMMIIIPQIIGRELSQDRIHYEDQRTYTKKQEIAEVVILANGIVLTHRKFWVENQYSGSSLCHVGCFTFKYAEHRPLLDGNKLVLGSLNGWGNEDWYIPINQEEQETEVDQLV